MRQAKSAAAASAPTGASSASAEEFDTATAMRKIHSKLTAAPPTQSGAPLALHTSAGVAQFVQTLRHVCVTGDVSADSFQALVWSVTSAPTAQLSDLVFGLFVDGAAGMALVCDALQHSVWLVRLATLPIVRALALCDVMFCRALAEARGVCGALHATVAAAAHTADAVSMHYACDILALLIPAHPKRVLTTLCTEYDSASPPSVALPTNKPLHVGGGAIKATAATTAAAAAPSSIPVPPLLPLLCRCLCDSVVTATAMVPVAAPGKDVPPAPELLPSLAFRQTTQTFVLRALFVAADTLGLEAGLLAHDASAVTYLTHYALAIRDDDSSLLTALSLVRLAQGLVRTSAQATRFTAGYSTRFLTRCLEWGFDMAVPTPEFAAAADVGAGAGAGDVKTPAAIAKVATDPAIASLAGGIAQQTAEWKKSSLDSADAAAAGDAEVDFGVESHANIWRVYCHACQKVANEDTLKSFARCGRCRLVTYCSADCQKRDWASTHKPQCFVNALLAPAPATAAPAASATATASAVTAK